MKGENEAEVFPDPTPVRGDVQTRQRSTIQFPYTDLASAVQLAEAIHGNVGLGECEDDQLAAWTKQSPKSSGYRVQVSAARLFGFLKGENGRHGVSELGKVVVDPARAPEAKAQAFLNVPLYRALFEKYRGGVLPNQAAALEREMVGLGVSEKVRDRARQVFERSAEQAGFFQNGRNKLVMPAVASVVTASASGAPSELPAGGGSGVPPHGGGGDLDLDPLLMALLKKIPSAGEPWPASKRVRWFRTFAMNVSQIYDVESEPVELRIDTADPA